MDLLTLTSHFITLNILFISVSTGVWMSQPWTERRGTSLPQAKSRWVRKPPFAACHANVYLEGLSSVALHSYPLNRRAIRAQRGAAYSFQLGLFMTDASTGDKSACDWRLCPCINEHKFTLFLVAQLARQQSRACTNKRQGTRQAAGDMLHLAQAAGTRSVCPPMQKPGHSVSGLGLGNK